MYRIQEASITFTCLFFTCLEDFVYRTEMICDQSPEVEHSTSISSNDPSITPSQCYHWLTKEKQLVSWMWCGKKKYFKVLLHKLLCVVSARPGAWSFSPTHEVMMIRCVVTSCALHPPSCNRTPGLLRGRGPSSFGVGRDWHRSVCQFLLIRQSQTVTGAL